MDFFVVPLLTFLLVSIRPPASDSPHAKESFQHLIQQAAGLRSQGEFEKSFVALERVLDNARQYRQRGRQGRCLIRMGIIKWDLGDTVASKHYLDEAERTFASTKDLRSQEFCIACLEVIELYELGNADRIAGLFHRSVERLERALVLGRDLGILDFQLKCLRQQAVANLGLRRLELFEVCCRRGLDIAKVIKHKPEEGRCLNNLGVYFQQKEDYAQAVACFEGALALIRDVGDQITEAECLNNLGLVYRQYGNLSRAKEFLERALKIDKALGNTISIAMDLDNLGSVLLRMGLEDHNTQDLHAAVETFETCLLLGNCELNNGLVLFTALNNMGVALCELGDHEGARRCFVRALNILESNAETPERCLILNNLGSLYLDEGGVEKAKRFYQSSLEIGMKHAFESVLIESCFGIGRCYEVSRDSASALAFYRRAIVATENMRSKVSSESLLIGLTRNKFGAYERAIHLLRSPGIILSGEKNIDEIYSLIERAKARVFLEGVYDARLDSTASNRRLLEERLRAISANISELSLRLTKPVGPNDELDALRMELELEEEEYVRLASERMGLLNSQEEGSWQNEIRTLGEIKKLLLSESAILLEYFLGEKESILLAISPDSTRHYILPPRGQIEESLRGYLKLISERTTDVRTGLEAARRIGSELIPVGMLESLNPADFMIVIPDGILYSLPFEALRIGEKESSRYLIEDFAVSYCPSASSMAALMEPLSRPLRPKEVLAVGSPNYRRTRALGDAVVLRRRTSLRTDRDKDWQEFAPLPFSEREVRSIAKFFPSGAADVLTGDAASEVNILSLRLQDYKIIHLACHAYLNERHPFRSALALSYIEGDREDGLLQMREIYGLTLRADLVVLSACQTGRGRFRMSEGPMALARPFFFAGARSVISTLWPVNDKAAVSFMHDFYARLIRGFSAAEALQYAKKQMLRSAWAHPFFWAGFLLQGDPSAVRETK